MKVKPMRWIQKGLTLVEVMLAAGILGVVILGASSFQQVVIRTTQNTGDRVFAAQKAVQIFEELRAFVQANQEDALNSLQSYNDTTYSPILTAERISNPADPLSKNTPISTANNTWKFLRKITVTDIANDTNAKSVTVSIFQGNANSPNEAKNNKPLATTSGILKTNIGKSPPTQVYDMYVIALENAPAWWADISTIRPIYENTMIEMGTRNPGLEFRKHVISRMSYGRDPFYMPYINTAGEAGAQKLPWVYLYPGKIKKDTKTNATEYYVEQNILGRKRTDSPESTEENASLFSVYKTGSAYTPNNGHTNVYRDYALADSFNYAVRYEEEVAMQKRLLAELDRQIEDTSDEQNRSVLLERKRLASEPSLRMLLEEMNANPDKYLNAMIVNLHAELVPVPPIRNYSDAAKRIASPDSTPVEDYYLHKRVVTHPEKLKYANTEREDIQLRVYPYEVIPPGTDKLDNKVKFYENNSGLSEQDTLDTITLFIPTDGSGRNPYNSVATGFLNNPNISDPKTSISIEVNKLVGNPSADSNTIQQVPYAWRKHTGTNFMKATDSDIVIGTKAMSEHPNNAVQVLGRISEVKVTGADADNPYIRIPRTRTATENDTAPQRAFDDSMTKADLCAQICNERFIVGGLNGEYNHRRIVRIRDVDKEASDWKIYLFKAESTFNTINNTNHNGYLMTRHRDYHINTNPSVYGQTRSGVLLTLFNSPTRHPINTSGNGGLPEARRLYGLEYIPAPIKQPDSGNIDYTFKLDKDNLTKDSNTEAKNTARWRIQVKGSTNIENQVLAVETRIGPRINQARLTGPLPSEVTFDPNKDISVRNEKLAETLEEGINGDGDVYQPNTASGDENRTKLRPFPHNVSRTYTYIGKDVPATESYQFLGDLRYLPYADIKAQHGYNWFAYRNKCRKNTDDGNYEDKLSNDCSNSDAGYANYNRKKNLGWSNVDADINRLFALYTDGIMRSKAIYNSISGYSSYYYAMGGEIGTDSNNTTFPIRKTPFQTGSSTQTYNSTDNDNVNVFNGGQDRYIQSTSSSYRWHANAWLGEIFPDEAARFWLNNGNLPTADYADTNAATLASWPSSFNTQFYRVGFNSSEAYFGRNDYSNTTTVSNTPSGTMPLSQRRKATADQGSAAFMNANTSGSDSSNLRVNHVSRDGQLAKLTYEEGNAGRYLIDSFNLSMPGILAASRPFKLDQGNGGNGYGDTEIKGKRNKVVHLNVQTGATATTPDASNVYYQQEDESSETASGLLKLTRNTNSTLTGYVLINGLSPSRDEGPSILARLAQGAMMQAYLAGGDFTGGKTTASASGRIVQLPRVEIAYPKAGASIKGDTSSLNVTAKLSWRRWDEQKYTGSYNDNWHEPMGLRLQLKYSLDDGRNWYFVNDSSTTKYDRLSNGVFYPAYEWGPQASLLTSSAERGGPTWNVSAWTSKQEKTPILLRLECYRTGYENQGYSYHEVRVTMGDL